MSKADTPAESEPDEVNNEATRDVDEVKALYEDATVLVDGKEIALHQMLDDLKNAQDELQRYQQEALLYLDALEDEIMLAWNRDEMVLAKQLEEVHAVAVEVFQHLQYGTTGAGTRDDEP